MLSSHTMNKQMNLDSSPGWSDHRSRVFPPWYILPLGSPKLATCSWTTSMDLNCQYLNSNKEKHRHCDGLMVGTGTEKHDRATKYEQMYKYINGGIYLTESEDWGVCNNPLKDGDERLGSWPFSPRANEAIIFCFLSSGVCGSDNVIFTICSCHFCVMWPKSSNWNISCMLGIVLIMSLVFNLSLQTR